VRILFATGNQGKVKEVKEKLSEFGIEVISLKELPHPLPPPPAETGSTFCENAHIKATYYAQKLNLPVMAEDSGLEVEALGGRPGVFSSRFASENATDEENNRKLIEELSALGLTESPARYVSFIFFAFPFQGGLWSEGEVRGKVVTTPRGEGGFGYDPLFIPEGFNKTMAELPLQVKNSISHRAKALERLVKAIKEIKCL
jgi:XTP/dITP diphosphohydrolase